MKTAISLPDDLFAEAERLARKKGIARSRLYTIALREYLQRQAHPNRTEQINRAIDEIGEDAFGIEPAMMVYQARRLANRKEDW